LKLLKLLSTANDGLKKSTNDLIGYCDDGDDAHFEAFASNMQIVINALEEDQQNGRMTSLNPNSSKKLPDRRELFLQSNSIPNVIP